MSVPTPRNPYYGPLRVAFESFVLLNGLLYQFDSHFKHRAAEIKDSLQRHRFRRVPWFAGAALVIRDLTEWPPDRWARYYSVGSHTRKGKGFLAAMQNIVALNSAWVVSQAFETFEVFAKDVVALYLKRNPTALCTPPWPRRRRGAGAGPKTRHLSAYRTFVTHAYGGADDLVRRLRRSIPDLAQHEQHNNRGLDLQEWVRVVAEVRHATVHRRGVLSPAQMKRLSTSARSILKANFPGEAVTRGYRLRLERKSAQDALIRSAEYALLIFKQISLREDLDWEVFKSVGIRA